jgi:hypothetical protein
MGATASTTAHPGAGTAASTARTWTNWRPAKPLILWRVMAAALATAVDAAA